MINTPLKPGRWNEESAVRRLARKKDVRVDVHQRIIIFPPKRQRIFDLGNKSWGIVDFLVNYKHYSIIYES
jgi:hypothetical protein